ncbi:MAG: aldolase [Ruminococcaceae bacterium]|nr:aldolase [Oscillospiraceae bacterium]
MNGRDFRDALHAGKFLYGMMLVSRSPKFAETIQTLGFDYIFIDTEHICVDRTTLSWMCQTFKAMNIAPIVRIPSPDPYEASMALDAGAEGIIAPYIETPEQVKTLVGAVKYKPLKGIKLENILNGIETPSPELKAYLENANRSKSLIVNIESIPAMENLDEIVKIDGLDGILIGPHDLSTSLGIPEQYTHPKYDAAVREILSKGRQAGIGSGIHVHYAGELSQEINWCRETGANFVVHHSDILSFTLAMKRDMAALRAGIEGTAEGNGETILNI